MKLLADAKKKLDAVATIFSRRDDGTKCEVTTKEFFGKVLGILVIRTSRHPFDPDSEKQLLKANIDLQGGFSDVRVALSQDRKELLARACYDGAANPDLRYGEVTVGELVKFIKDHSPNFPRGMKTKISLGDFEGNTCHRKVSVGTDDGRLHLSYELHERVS